MSEKVYALIWPVLEITSLNSLFHTMLEGKFSSTLTLKTWLIIASGESCFVYNPSYLVQCFSTCIEVNT